MDVLTPGQLAVVGLALFLGGVLKGVVGVGLPAVALPIMTPVIGLVNAVGMLSAPTLASNVIQLNEGGFGLAVLKRFWTLIVPLSVATVVGAHVLAQMDRATSLIVVGALSILFVVSQVAKPNVSIDPLVERRLNPVVGAVSGLIGGASSVFGPPLVAYMIALRLPRDEFICSLSVIYMIACITLYGMLGTLGVLTGTVLTVSIAGTIPAFLGVWLGRLIRRRVPEQTFRRITIGCLAILGADMLRRGLSHP